MDNQNSQQIKGINESLYNSEPAQKLHPILKCPRSQSEILERKDYYGNPIVKGSKAYKIKFKEQNQIIQVENWKQYNSDSSVSNEPPCVCRLF